MSNQILIKIILALVYSFVAVVIALLIYKDVCYQLYTYCEIKNKKIWYLKEKVEDES